MAQHAYPTNGEVSPSNHGAGELFALCTRPRGSRGIFLQSAATGGGVTDSVSQSPCSLFVARCEKGSHTNAALRSISGTSAARSRSLLNLGGGRLRLTPALFFESTDQSGGTQHLQQLPAPAAAVVRAMCSPETPAPKLQRANKTPASLSPSNKASSGLAPPGNLQPGASVSTGPA